MLNRRVVLHAIEQASRRWRGDAGSLVDFHTGAGALEDVDEDENRARGDHETEDDEAAACVEINQCVGCSRSRVDGVEDDATIQHERAVRF